MTERIQKAIDIFLDALNKGTLAKGTCRACAVGNLVAAGMGINIIPTYLSNGELEFEIDSPINNGDWGMLFSTVYDGKQHIRIDNLNISFVQTCIRATDFTWQELAKIENAFERNTSISYENYHFHSNEEVRKDQIKGLEAVVKVMMTFDDVQEKVEEVFTQKAELIPV